MDRVGVVLDLEVAATAPDDSEAAKHLYVASILLDTEMIREAAALFRLAAGMYLHESRLELVQGLAGESYHSWPVNRGWTWADINLPLSAFWMATAGGASTAASMVRVNPDRMSVRQGLQRTSQRMAAIEAAQGHPDIEDIAFVLRGLLLLRDITKVEKKRGGRPQPPQRLGTPDPANDANYRRLIVGQGVQASRNHWTKPRMPSTLVGDQSDSSFSKVDWILDSVRGGSRVADTRALYQQGAFDRLQGMSGSTLDYTNWLTALGLDSFTVMRLFQVNYAAWHFVAPDGWAHSQFESINLLMKKYCDLTLIQHLMAPIKAQPDVAAAQQGGHLAQGHPDNVTLQ